MEKLTTHLMPSERNELQDDLAVIRDGFLDYRYSLLQILWCHSWVCNVPLIFFRSSVQDLAAPPGCHYAQSYVHKCFSKEVCTLVQFGNT